ncbi:hypothetical protein XENTR_v10022230 [Xenopus tropicalis]|uniref:G-protein coupled receptors family 1 profile domain-containing protein n=2 Tax=Xenopus tropicalis TaxID=8364 RepID=A0A803JMK2_XENTR|nr:hypothetical protein XENTR_v10022230 [Xenopus tropicalis]
MYFFISILAVLEIIYMSAIHPRFLASLISKNNRISFIGCFVQMFVADTLGAAESYLLAVMAFDRDLAINRPLHYPAVMTKRFCIGLAVLPWLIGTVIMFIGTMLTANLEFCGPNEIDHFFCDFPPLQILACSDSLVSNAVTSVLAVIGCGIPFFIILVVYIRIIITVSKIKTSKGKQRAFSTCSSHLIVASLYYVTLGIVYFKPNGNPYKKYFTLMYALISPVLNPFIYTLRNKDVKAALSKSKLLNIVPCLFHYSQSR